jgi:hypothetical protein
MLSAFNFISSVKFVKLTTTLLRIQLLNSNRLFLLTYSHGTRGSNHAINGALGEWVKQTVASPHEVGFQQIAAVIVVLKLALIQLHAKVGCLEVQGHHLTAGVPENLRNTVLGTNCRFLANHIKNNTCSCSYRQLTCGI